MRFPVLLIHIVHVVGCHKRKSQLIRQLQLVGSDGLFVIKSVVLKFHIEVAFPEDIEKRQSLFLSSFIVAVQKHPLHISRKAGAEADDALAVSPEYVLVDTRLIVVAFHVSYGYDLDEILVAGFIFCKQNQMPLTFVPFGIFISMSSGSCVYLAADDGPDALSLAFLIEIHRSEHGTVVGDGKAGHTQFLSSGNHVLYPGSAVKKTVFSM